MLPLPFLPYEGGPTIIEWLNQICQKFNELLTAVKNVRELPPGGTHGQVPTIASDGESVEWKTPSGGGSGDVVAAGNNVFTGTNHFEGLTVLGETHAETPTNNNDVTNKLYVDTLAGTTKTSAVTEAEEHTDSKISALRTLPAGGTSGQVPTIASDGESVEWKTPSGGGGGGVEWVEATISQAYSTNLNIDNLKLWYDKNDHQHLKFEGYIWATYGYSNVLNIIMPNDFSAVVSDMWVPLLALAGSYTSTLSTVVLYVQHNTAHRLYIYPSGTSNNWLANRRYAVGSEIYLNPSQLIQSNSDEVNDDIVIHTSDDAGTQHGEEY